MTRRVQAVLRSDGTLTFWGPVGNGSVLWRPFPPLPFGVYYVELDGAQNLLVARRSDGQVVMQGDMAASALDFVPPLPPGTSYVGISAQYEQDVVARIGPTSTYVTFATGCAGSLPPARLVPRDTPRVGSALAVTLFDLPLSSAVMVMGFDRLSTPQPLALLGMPGCFGRIRADAPVFLGGQGTQARYELQIPNVMGLVGLRCHNQAVVLDPGANPLGAVVSDAAEAVVGHW